jgi:hypothetical protein
MMMMTMILYQQMLPQKNSVYKDEFCILLKVIISFILEK